MQMKRLNKVLIVLVSIILILTSMQYAVNANESKVTKENLEKSLTKLTDKNIKINTKSENSSGEMTIDTSAYNFEIGESKIHFVHKSENEVSFDINYSIANEKCRFYTNINLNNEDETNEEEAFKKSYIYMEQMSFIQVCYLVAADVYEKDLSLAYTYYMQEYNKVQQNIEEDFKEIDSDIYKYNQYKDENTLQLDLEINLKELENLSEEDIDSSHTAIVELIDDTQNDEKIEVNEQLKQNEQTQENEVLENNEDGTLQNSGITQLPQTGKTMKNIDVLFTILLISVSILALYIVYNRKIDGNK